MLFLEEVFENFNEWNNCKWQEMPEILPNWQQFKPEIYSRLRGRGFEPHRRHCVVSLSKDINSSLVLVLPRKTRPFITERLLMGRKESNQTNKTNFWVLMLSINICSEKVACFPCLLYSCSWSRGRCWDRDFKIYFSVTLIVLSWQTV